MRQLITRIDEELLQRVKARAAEEGRSVNALVTELLETAVSKSSPREILRARLRALGLLAVVPPPRGKLPSRDEVIASTRGAGRAVSDALEADRNKR